MEAQINGDIWHIIIVDLASNPALPRRPALEKALSWAAGRERTVVMGDFNTPLGSTGFDLWKEKLHHALSTSGEGLLETWPRWLPILSLDHIWSSLDVPPVKARKLWRNSSDHAAIIAELTTASSPPSPEPPPSGP
jgi:endonuclease/exonuclease/phosphatase family metal-dependent hydrolase